MDLKHIILASRSPRRIELMNREGLYPSVVPADIEENLPEGIAPDDAVMLLSFKKALHVERTHPEFAGQLIIAADTVVYQDKILGKPVDHEDAREMITMLQGNIHQVYTGVTLIVKDAKGNIHTRTFNECTDVDVCEMSSEEVEEYISTKEPYDKAGAYGIQGSFGVYIRGIRGCYYNVVGLPISRLCHELKDMLAQ